MDSVKQEKYASGFLLLEDGSYFPGRSFGAACDQPGEVVFNTGMAGYQEILTDPSYAGQIVTLTTAEVGNYGCNVEDAESRGLWVNGLVINHYNEPSNFRSTCSLADYLREAKVPGLCDVDTRALTLHLREHGALRGWIHTLGTLTREEALAKVQAWSGLVGQDYATKVSTPKVYDWNLEGAHHVVVMDFGVKYSILRNLEACDCRITVVPAHTTAEEIAALKPDGILLSNGPADPAALTYAIATIRELLATVVSQGVPLMGICLGHQLLGLACGATCGRLKFGHHGCNHPIRELATGLMTITSQNHNYALTQLPETLEATHINGNDESIAGIRHVTLPAFGIQYHPEAGPGPHDAFPLFTHFQQQMAARAAKEHTHD